MTYPARTPHRGLRRLLRPAQAGFSLIELGIVIAVIAVLSVAVIASKGYITAAKKKAAVDLVNAIRTAGEQFAMRHNNGVTFVNTNDTGGNLSLKALQGQNFLSTDLTTPWGAPGTEILVGPDDSAFCNGIGGGANCSRCAGSACMSIDFPVPDDDTCNDLAIALKGVSVAVQCSGQHLKVSTR